MFAVTTSPTKPLTEVLVNLADTYGAVARVDRYTGVTIESPHSAASLNVSKDPDARLAKVSTADDDYCDVVVVSLAPDVAVGFVHGWLRGLGLTS